MQKIPVWKASIFLFCTGLCALLYQVVWLREMRVVFGSSTVATSVVLAVFMGGLGIGALVIGRRADRFKKPLAVYGYLEFAIACSVFLSPFLLIFCRKLYIGLGGIEGMGLPMATLIRITFSVLILLVPTFLMGGSLPAMVKAVETSEDRGRRDLGLLYGFNTLGGVLGVGLTTFLLLELFGNRTTLWAGCLLNLLIAGIAIYTSINLSHPESKEEKVFVKAEPATENTPQTVKLVTIFLYIAAFIAGFIFLLMELVWYRMLAPILGGSTYTFGLILAVALFGIGLGGWLYGRRNHQQRPNLSIFAIVCSMEALCIVIPFALGDRLAILAALLKSLAAIGFGGQILGWLIVVVVIVLPASIMAGIQFPMIIALLGKGDLQVGRQTGHVYASNTAGAILGSLAGGFGLIPLLSAPGCWQLVVIFLLFLAFTTLIISKLHEKKFYIYGVPSSLIIISLLLLNAEGPTATWRHSGIGVGHRVDIFGMNPNELYDWQEKYRRQIIWEVDGRESSVALHAYDSLSFIVNGKSDGNAVIDAPTQIMGPLIGAILHPNPQQGLVIGLGTGSSGGWLAEVPTMKKVDVVEIEPAILEVARRSTPVNYDVMEHPKVNIVIGDGREFVQTTEKKYDVIFSEPSDPYRAGIASLYTKEFYEAIAKRLSPDGIFSQWVHTYYVDGLTIRTIAATLGSVFPDVEIWITDDSNLLFVCSNEPKQYNVKKLRHTLQIDPFQSALAYAWGGTNLEHFLAGYVAQPSLVREIAAAEVKHGNINTDDLMLAEFGFARTTGRLGLFSVDELRQEVRRNDMHKPMVIDGEINWQEVEDNYFQMMLWFNMNISSNQRFTYNQQQQARIYQGYRDGNYRQIVDAWNAGVWPYKTLLEKAVLAESLAEAGDRKALSIAASLHPIWDGTANAIEARYYWRLGEKELASKFIIKAINNFKKSPWQFRPIIVHTLQLSMEIAHNGSYAKKLYKLLAEPMSVYNFDEYRKFVLLQISKTLEPQLTVEALSQLEPHVPWNESILNDRVKYYKNEGSPLLFKAQRDLQKFQENQPNSFFGLAN